MGAGGLRPVQLMFLGARLLPLLQQLDGLPRRVADVLEGHRRRLQLHGWGMALSLARAGEACLTPHVAYISAACGTAMAWREEGRLVLRLRFNSFMDAVRFVGEVAEVAERLGHHPDISIRYTLVELATTTHDAGNVVTDRDRRLAEEISRLLARWEGRYREA